MSSEMEIKMKRDLKIFFSLSRYALNYKSTLIMSVIFAVIGFMWDFSAIFWPEVFIIGFDAGAYFMVLAGATYAQLCFSVVYAGLGATSMEYRNVLLKYSVLFVSCTSFISILISVLIHMIALTCNPSVLPKLSFSMFEIGLFAFFIQAYFAVAYKLYAISSVAFSLLIAPIAFVSTRYRLYESVSNVPLALAILCAFVLTIAGSATYYGITKGIYKKPFDSQAFRTAIAKAAK